MTVAFVEHITNINTGDVCTYVHNSGGCACHFPFSMALVTTMDSIYIVGCGAYLEGKFPPKLEGQFPPTSSFEDKTSYMSMSIMA